MPQTVDVSFHTRQRAISAISERRLTKGNPKRLREGLSRMDKLPNEIFVHILQFVVSKIMEENGVYGITDKGLQSYHNLILVNRRFYTFMKQFIEFEGQHLGDLFLERQEHAIQEMLSQPMCQWCVSQCGPIWRSPLFTRYMHQLILCSHSTYGYEFLPNCCRKFGYTFLFQLPLRLEYDLELTLSPTGDLSSLLRTKLWEPLYVGQEISWDVGGDKLSFTVGKYRLPCVYQDPANHKAPWYLAGVSITQCYADFKRGRRRRMRWGRLDNPPHVWSKGRYWLLYWRDDYGQIKDYYVIDYGQNRMRVKNDGFVYAPEHFYL